MTQGGVEYVGFSFVYDENNNLMRLPTAGLVPGAAELQLEQPGTGERTASFPITISAAPAAPNLLDARRSFVEAATPVGTVEVGGQLTLLAQNTDTSGVTAVFDVGGVDLYADFLMHLI